MMLSDNFSEEIEGTDFFNVEDNEREQPRDANDGDVNQETAHGDWYWDDENSEWYWVYFNNDETGEDDDDDQTYSHGGNDSEFEEESTSEYETESEGTHIGSSRPMETLVVYDWDDTFLPTSYIKEYFQVKSLGSSVGDIIVDWELRTQLEELEQSIIDLLERSLSLGTVKIVTNAGYGWVEKSGAKFMPALLQFLYDEDIEIISARWLHSNDFPDDVWEHKKQVFHTEVRNMLEKENNLYGIFRFFSVGDSQFERYAAQSLVNVISERWIKILKLEERPNIEQVQYQIDRLLTILTGIFEEEGYMDLSFEVG